ncbi:MAG: methyltransferase domain-containing protein [Planctomycetes bacterium]|nr:methyltransferase domain-containing protein [Planctomycetota bacterium]
MHRTRLESERLFHDEQAAQRAGALRPCDYVFSDDAYLQHESWIAPALDLLGEVRGKRILDLGCGHGMASVVLARRGAQVIGCDLSAGYVQEASQRAKANHASVQHVVCDAERLPFADEAFDGIWGNAILHHLDLELAAAELRRVLAPGGQAVFCEPWAGNRLLNWARRELPYPGKHRTADESPLTFADLCRLKRSFPRLRVRGYQILAMLGRLCRSSWLLAGLRWCDDWLLMKWPGWQRYCRYVVLHFAKFSPPS